MNQSLLGVALALYAVTVVAGALTLSWAAHSIRRSRRPAHRARGRRTAIPLYLAVMVAAAAALIIVLGRAGGAEPGRAGVDAIFLLVRPHVGTLGLAALALTVVAVALHLLPWWLRLIFALPAVASVVVLSGLLWTLLLDPTLQLHSLEVRHTVPGVIQWRPPSRAVPWLENPLDQIEACSAVTVLYGVTDIGGDWQEPHPASMNWQGDRLVVRFTRTTIHPLIFWLPQREVVRSAAHDSATESTWQRWVWAALLRHGFVRQATCEALVPERPYFLPLGTHRILIR